MPESIPTITLYGPWAQFVALALKPIETRGHNQFRGLVGKRIGIHAAKKFVREDLDWAIEEFGLDPELVNHPLMAARGAVLCTAFVRNHIRLTGGHNQRRGALCDCAGMNGLILDSIERIDPPVIVPGAMGIWQWDGKPSAQEKDLFA